MRGVHDALAAAGLLAAALGAGHKGLVADEQQQVRPLGQQGRTLPGELEFPVIEGTHFLGQLLLAHTGMGYDDHIAARSQHILAGAEHPGKLLGEVGVALAEAEGFQSGLLVLLTDVLDGHLFCPVSGINDQRCTAGRVAGHLLYGVQQALPAGELVDAVDIEVGRAALGVQKQRVGRVRRQRALAGALKAVDHGLDRLVQASALDRKHGNPPYSSSSSSSKSSAAQTGLPS